MAVREWEKVVGRVLIFSPFVRLSEPRVGAVNARVKGAQRKVLNRVDLLLSLAGGEFRAVQCPKWGFSPFWEIAQRANLFEFEAFSGVPVETLSRFRNCAKTWGMMGYMVTSGNIQS